VFLYGLDQSFVGLSPIVNINLVLLGTIEGCPFSQEAPLSDKGELGIVHGASQGHGSAKFIGESSEHNMLCPPSLETCNNLGQDLEIIRSELAYTLGGRTVDNPSLLVCTRIGNDSRSRVRVREEV
jgi:hypothetical protein